ncbi:hypothetical protein HPB48_000058 [Haemaphysalis longicornis]|uniref:Uncharacterized protein n=1 Tax=Haemaphysalis longicornis TaxID=44386 RepID=A0A9J6GUP2_HAELO|nr:hypothetical protein HPB48_000058 [Haemaphysalis longicornis]
MYDGMWQKRGHERYSGIGTAVSLDTGLCFNFEVLPNFCLACSRHKVLPDEEGKIDKLSMPLYAKKTLTARRMQWKQKQ